MSASVMDQRDLASSDSGSSLTSVIAVLSMLHEDAERNSATRAFRGEPVLSWTLRRLCGAQSLGNITVLCWEDQLPQVEEIAEEHHAYVLAKGPRQRVAMIDAVAAARRWADGWRGGLLSTCDFDLGFHPGWVNEICERLDGDAAVLVDPSAGMIDPALIDRVVEHASRTPHVELCFTQAAPGLGGALLRRALVQRLSQSPSHPGRLLHYMPDHPMRDPIGSDACAPVATTVARSARSYRLDSDRQLRRIELASVGLNGQLAGSAAEELVRRFEWPCEGEDAPRELTIELNTSRRSNPIFWPGGQLKIERSPSGIKAWSKLFIEAASAADDVRLTIGGVGDPLESELLFESIDAAQSAGIRAIHVQTDLLSDDPRRIERLVESGIDVVSVNLPAMSVETYAAVMGVDGFQRALQNVAHFFRVRHERGLGVPLLVPVFVKMKQNLAEMETWYDRWLKTLGCAVIAGPSDFAGQIPDTNVADMSPTKRSACARLNSRMSVLCDGSVVICEQDVLGKHAVGRIGETSLLELWRDRLSRVRSDHKNGEWNKLGLCAGCREWHRP